MANVRLAVLTRNAMVDAVSGRIDADANGGTIKIYTGTQPATGDTALSGNTLLATLTWSTTSFAAASSGTATANAVTQDSSADATGTATWARIQDESGDNVFDCDVTATGGGGTIQLNTTSIVSGGPVQITAFTLTQPAGSRCMALRVVERIRETTSTTGTGSLTLSGAASGCQSFANALASGDETTFAIVHQSAAEWEIARGVFTSPSTLTRARVFQSAQLRRGGQLLGRHEGRVHHPCAERRGVDEGARRDAVGLRGRAVHGVRALVFQRHRQPARHARGSAAGAAVGATATHTGARQQRRRGGSAKSDDLPRARHHVRVDTRDAADGSGRGVRDDQRRQRLRQRCGRRDAVQGKPADSAPATADEERGEDGGQWIERERRVHVHLYRFVPQLLQRRLDPLHDYRERLPRVHDDANGANDCVAAERRRRHGRDAGDISSMACRRERSRVRAGTRTWPLARAFPSGIP